MPEPAAIPDAVFQFPSGEHVFRVDLPHAAAIVGLACSPLRDGSEDVAAVFPVGPRAAVLAVADGAGGHAAGELAARLTIDTLHQACEGLDLAPTEDADAQIERAIARANRRLVEGDTDAACTLVVALVNDRRVRTYHVGDAQALVTGQRGRIKHVTLAHSPVHELHEAGEINEREALHHEQRHIVSNLVGDPEMHIDAADPVRLAARDTLVLASDGLFDNFTLAEISEMIRVGGLEKAGERVMRRTRARMTSESEGRPSKPDDLSFVLYRPGHSKRSR